MVGVSVYHEVGIVRDDDDLPAFARIAEVGNQIGEHGLGIQILFRLVDDLPPDDVAAMEIPQDRVLRLRGSRLDWL